MASPCTITTPLENKLAVTLFGKFHVAKRRQIRCASCGTSPQFQASNIPYASCKCHNKIWVFEDDIKRSPVNHSKPVFDDEVSIECADCNTIIFVQEGSPGSTKHVFCRCPQKHIIEWKEQGNGSRLGTVSDFGRFKIATSEDTICAHCGRTPTQDKDSPGYLSCYCTNNIWIMRDAIKTPRILCHRLYLTGSHERVHCIQCTHCNTVINIREGAGLPLFCRCPRQHCTYWLFPPVPKDKLPVTKI